MASYLGDTPLAHVGYGPMTFVALGGLSSNDRGAKGSIMTTTTSVPHADPTAIGAGNPKALTIAGWVLTGLGGSFLLFDGVNHLLQTPSAAKATAVIGWQPGAFVPLAIIQLVFLALYLVPRTSVFGAILLTAYLGGAVGANVRVDAPFFDSIMSGVYVGIVLWAALYLRNPQLRRLVPFGR
jgi:hypothetical protein